jgi:hypothetical protein
MQKSAFESCISSAKGGFIEFGVMSQNRFVLEISVPNGFFDSKNALRLHDRQNVKRTNSHDCTQRRVSKRQEFY